MFAFRILGAASLLTVAASASASSFLATTDTLGASLANSVETTSDASFSLRDDKRIVQAHADAASFVASNGEIRGARLEAALVFLRAQPAVAGHSDLELAQAIVAR